VQLGDLLVRDGSITPEARDAALAQVAAGGGRLGSALIAAGAPADRVAQALARQHGVLVALDAQLAQVPPNVRELVPGDLARRLCAVPVRVAPGTGELIVALRDPNDPTAVAELEAATGRRVRAAAAAEIRILQAMGADLGPARSRPVSTAPPMISPAIPLAARPAPAATPRPVVRPHVPPRYGLIGTLAAVVVAVVGFWAYKRFVRPDFEVSNRPLAELAGVTPPPLGDDWRGPASVEVDAGDDDASARNPTGLNGYAAAYARGAAHGEVRDTLVVQRIIPKAAYDNVALKDMLYDDGAALSRFDGMRFESWDCQPSTDIRTTPVMVCDAVATRRGETVQVRQIDWIVKGELLRVAGVTYGSADDIREVVDATALTMEPAFGFEPADGRDRLRGLRRAP
jgi:hypothetical protein